MNEAMATSLNKHADAVWAAASSATYVSPDLAWTLYESAKELRRLAVLFASPRDVRDGDGEAEQA